MDNIEKSMTTNNFKQFFKQIYVHEAYQSISIWVSIQVLAE